MTVFSSEKSKIKLGFLTTTGHDTVYWYSIIKEEKQLRNYEILIQKMVIRAKRLSFFQNVRKIEIYSTQDRKKIGVINDLNNVIIEWNVQ